MEHGPDPAWTRAVALGCAVPLGLGLVAVTLGVLYAVWRLAL
ncbi:MAG: hypothetical protein JWM64_167 [Frankiales bacterium]|nr:hypothetical protein [Frankiales bacterium]